MKRIVIFLIILASFIFTTCDVALGTKINMLGPIVTITGPQPKPAETDPLVSSVFELTGTVESPSKISRVTVTIDHWNGKSIVRMGREWRWDGSWQTRESSDNSWKQYKREAYEIEDPLNVIKNPSWNSQETVSNFSLPVFMTRMESGEYFITVSAWDSAGLHDSNSSKQLKVRFSNVAPKLEIRIPTLYFSEGTSLAYPKAPSFDHLVFDPFGRPVDTNDNIKTFTNDFKGLSWKIERGNSDLDGSKLTLMITNEHNLDTKEGRIIYFEWDYDSIANGSMPQSGVHDGSDSKFPVIELESTLKAALPKDKVTTLQLVSILEDDLQNTEYKSNGWFFYLPDSDKPYPEITFGTPVKAGETPAANTADIKRMFRGTRDNSRAFDDDGVQTIEYTVYRLLGNTYNVDEAFGPISPEIINPGATRLNWPFIAERSWGTGRFKIVVSVTDINGTKGDDYTAYFSIDSNSTPTLREWTFNQDDTLWGSTNGDFTLSGKAQIECSDECVQTGKTGHSVMVESVIIVWINPEDRSQDNITRYKTPGDPLWEFTGDTSKDDKGNIRFRVPANNITFDSNTAGNLNGNSQENWNFSLTKNWFTDIGIGQGDGQFKFENQTFEVKFISSGTTSLSGVASVTALGDQKAPVLTVTSIEFNDKVKTETINLTSGILFPQIPEGAQIKINGTWSDDSVGKWSGLGSSRHQTLTKEFSVRWEGEQNKVNMPSPALILNTTDGGTWTTGWYTFTAQNTDPFVEIIASLKDLNDGPGAGNYLLNVETDYPTLTRISSTIFDGRYGNYKDTYSDVPGSRYIDIFLDFNKTIDFIHAGAEPTATTTPYLILNNNGRAYYAGGNKSSRITFRYFIDNVTNGVGSIPAAGSQASNEVSRLNVTGIHWGSYPMAQWKSIQNDDAVLFPADIYNGANINESRSLYNQKSIIIDKSHPIILASNGITSSTSNSRPHGFGSQVRITVTFNEDIRVASNASPSNLYLNLGGGLGTAVFDTAGPRNVNFVYTVGTGHNSAEINVASMVGNNLITDIAGNAVMSTTGGSGSNGAFTITYTSNLGRVLKVETRTPSTPAISGITANTNYYGTTNNFTINTNANAAYNSTIQTIEYCLNYTGTANDEWLTYSGTVTNNITNNIPLSINGTYNIAARVLDNATTQNQSAVVTVNNVTVNIGHILERVTSANPDGIYGHPDKTTIDIDLEFRIPVRLSGTAANVTLTMGQVTGATNAAILQNPASDVKKWTFRYTIDAAASTSGNKLNVTGINFAGGAGITDASGNNINSLVAISGVSTSNQFNSQKDIQILSGRPNLTGTIPTAVLTPSTSTTANMVFTTSGAGLNMIFDRDIYRGNTASKLIARQIPNSYRIPAVMNSDKYTQIFSGREDIFNEHSDILTGTPFTSGTAATRAGYWKQIGEYLYQEGSNGAAEATTTRLTSDTTIKYVLKYTVDTAAADTAQIGLAIAGTQVTMEMVRNMFRAAEALSFGVNDPEVKITNISGTPRRLEIHFSERSGLPVRGAMYEVIFPNGFVKDILGKANGIGGGTDVTPTGKDTNISSAGTTTTSARVLNLNTATEAPVIRIDKGNDDAPGYQGSGNFRNVHQPLTTTFKIDGRTPNSTFSYHTRQTTDNVYTLANRNGGTSTAATDYMRLPNLGTQTQNAAGQASFVATRLRPQSGGSPWTTATGLNHFTAMGAWPTGNATTGSGAAIGLDNYNSGGMEINIRARAAANNVNSDYAYEAAYRSMFIFNNQNDLNNANARVFDSYTANTRVWLRGGNSTQGDPTIPDFPISRDPTKWRKVKLMSPINATAFASATSTVTNTNVISSTTTDNLDSGRRLWVWVTWRINVPAFVDLHTGDLPAAEAGYPAPSANIRQFFQAWVPQKEHYAVHPGRTTIAESRNSGTQWDGDHGNVIQTSAKAPETASDM